MLIKLRHILLLIRHFAFTHYNGEERKKTRAHTHTHRLPQKQHHKYWTQAKLYNLLLSFTLTGELEIGNNKKKGGKTKSQRSRH
jgi:hypothetical protein